MTAAPAMRLGWLRAAGLAAFVLTAGAFAVAVPARWVELPHPAPLIRAHLTALGWPLLPYAALTFGSELVFTLAFYLAGLVLFARRSNEWMALFTAVMLAAFGVGNYNMTHTLDVLHPYPGGPLLIGLLGFAGWAAFTNFPYLFPTGRYVPAWTWLPALGWVLISVGWNLLPGTALDPSQWPLYGLVHLALLLSLAYSLVYRYLRVSTPIERQQTKWVWYGAAVILIWETIWVGVQTAVGNQVLAYVGGAGGDPPTPELFAIVRGVQAGSRLVYLVLPFTLAIAILRYRLWDIDILIRRTLVYSVLTGLLAFVYLSSVVALQALLRGIISSGSPLVIVLSTLLIAALFVPVRSRVQRAIDRRFYRRKYDAARTLAVFGAQARDETNLSTLSQRLQLAVQETMQPAHISLWLKDNRPE